MLLKVFGNVLNFMVCTMPNSAFVLMTGLLGNTAQGATFAHNGVAPSDLKERKEKKNISGFELAFDKVS